ncbi:GTP-binding protein RHO3 [Penicillium macrosclerotiorum]|uniref:GTP-binding protein RHO3 n=1 Tax=Penicillium macrosclerotiorum TaxID=303699 RepID=UPI002548C38A|nr:GTP-binding protein RHO3 [Penicillium macrosclerotiorum]KAJ5692383.1 GTP-binding protein RHO3 [Penicillium macrosclerotiorum]
MQPATRQKSPEIAKKSAKSVAWPQSPKPASVGGEGRGTETDVVLYSPIPFRARCHRPGQCWNPLLPLDFLFRSLVQTLPLHQIGPIALILPAISYTRSIPLADLGNFPLNRRPFAMELCGRQKVVQRKMVLLGDGACGKTSALNLIAHTDIFVDNVHVELSLWDTAGQEEFDRLRALSYEDTHVLMLCFSIDSRDSFENVGSKWITEINENCPGVRVVLTALKCDLRKDDEQNDNPDAITFDQGLAKAKEIGANRGIRESFYEAAKVALEVKPAGAKGSSSSCVIL